MLGKASIVLAIMCEHHAAATTQTRNALRQRVGSEIYDLLERIATSEGAVAISAALEALFNPALLVDCAYIILTKYFQPLNTFKQTWGAVELLKELQESVKRVPTVQAMEAQGESVGDRAMHDFNYPGLRGTDGLGKGSQGRFAPPGYVKYPIDLAGQEGEGGLSPNHVIDKHVGKTDEQLQHRLDSEPPDKSRSASSFTSLADAQKYVQLAINSPDGERLIDRMIALNKPSTQITHDAHTPVGHSLDRDGNITNTTKVFLIIRHAPPGVTPPFFVNTAYPTV